MVSNRKDPEGYLWTKRTIAFPGDTLQINDDEVFVNHKYLEEPYAYFQNGKARNHIEIVLPAQEYFVMGDNRNESLDSRHSEYGLIKRNEIIGVLVMKFTV